MRRKLRLLNCCVVMSILLTGCQSASDIKKEEKQSGTVTETVVETESDAELESDADSNSANESSDKADAGSQAAVGLGTVKGASTEQKESAQNGNAGQSGTVNQSSNLAASAGISAVSTEQLQTEAAEIRGTGSDVVFEESPIEVYYPETEAAAANETQVAANEVQTAAYEEEYVQCPYCAHWFSTLDDGNGSAYDRHLAEERATDSAHGLTEAELAECPDCGNWYPTGNVFRNHICEGRE